MLSLSARFSRLAVDGSRSLATAASPAAAAKKSKAPVPPLSGYQIFIKKNFDKASHPDVTSAFRSLSQQWKQLGESDKAKYESLASAEKAAHVAAFEKLSEAEQSAKLAEAQKEKDERKKRRERKLRRTERAESGRPKQPLNTWALFVEDRFTAKKKGGEKVTPVTETMKVIKEEFGKLSEAEKKKYDTKAASLRATYAQQLAAWKEKMAKKEEGKEEKQ